MTAASAPLRQVVFMCFMMWMMGNGIQIFSIIMTLSGLATPVMAIVNSGKGGLWPDQTTVLTVQHEELAGYSKPPALVLL